MSVILYYIRMSYQYYYFYLDWDKRNLFYVTCSSLCGLSRVPINWKPSLRLLTNELGAGSYDGLHLFLLTWLIMCPFFVNYKIFITAFPSKIKVFSTVTIAFFTNSLPTYLNYKTILWGVRSHFEGILEFDSQLILDRSFWSLDLFEKILSVH